MSSRDLNPTAASLLGFLQRGPMTGWELDRAVAGSIGNFWNVTRSQIYRELPLLSDRGYVVAGEPGPRDRVRYTLTDAGRAAFSEWINREPGPDLIRMRFLLTVFFNDSLEPGRLAELAAGQRRVHEGRLAEFRALQSSLPEPEATLRFGISFEETLVEWLTSLERGGGSVAST
ncbi:MAG: PadR family transcriptional regulator [Acidimicrobiales bacterium]